MASEITPGGGVTKGSMAQEEELFRRSDLHRHLPRRLYPLSDEQVIFSKGVWVFKDTDYALLQSPFYVHTITCAGIRRPSIVNHNKLEHRDDIETYRCKMYAILESASECHTVILGAFGCGAFRGPPDHISRLFKSTIRLFFQHNQTTSIKKIKFAVLCRDDTKNFDTFASCFPA